MHKLCIIAAAILMLAGCASHRSPHARVADRKYTVVNVSYDYDANERPARQWHALVQALDLCHAKGYRDAQIVGQPKTSCEQTTRNACTRYSATASYDCIGVNYNN